MPTQSPYTPVHGPVGLGDFLRSHRNEILKEWETEVRKLPVARDLERLALIDHIPEVLDQIAEMTEDLTTGRVPQLPKELAELHATERLQEGFDLTQVVTEFGVLRDCVMRRWQEPDVRTIAELRLLNQAIDKAVSASVGRFTTARDRTLLAVDRIATEALASGDLPDLLRRLLQVFVETTTAVDTATIMIREGTKLRVRAAIGLEEELAQGFTLEIGEGFAGRIAAEQRPQALTHASEDPLVTSEVMRRAGIRALYGLPISDGGEVLGVAYMGSRTANEFSKQDRYLLNTMAARAAAAIYQRILRENAEKSTAELSAVIESIPAPIFMGTKDGITRANRAALSLMGYHGVGDLDYPIAELAARLDLRDATTGEAISRTNDPFSQALVEGRTQFRELVMRNASTGDEISVHSIAAPIVRDEKIVGAVSINIDITERRRIETLLRKRELEFRSLAENISQLAWITDGTGWIYWYNKRWFDFTGTSLEETQGWGWQKVHHPDHVRRVTERFRSSIERGESWQDTFPLRSRDGQYRWFLSRATPVRDERGQIVRWFGTNTDVTEQRFLANATEILSSSLDARTSLDQLATLAIPEFADCCIIDLIEEGSVERVAIAHLDPVKIQRASRARVSLNQPGGIAEVLRTGQPIYVPEVSDEHVLESAPDGEPFAALPELGLTSCIVAPLTARGMTLGAITLLQTESKRRFSPSDLETAIELGRRAGIAIDHARLFGEVQDAVQAREEILAIVSHDLRNPLGVIDLGATMAMGAEPLSPVARKYLLTIQRSASRMERLLRDLLDTASLQVGRFTMELKAEEVSTLVGEVVDAHAALAKQKGIDLVQESEIRDTYICCDRERLMQAFGNLIGNAIKFCRPGDIVVVRAHLENGHAKLEVMDTGPGIAPREIPHVFEPYWSAKRHARKGTGLGLYICKGIIEGHHGTLTVESKLGEGTTFSIALPLAPGAELPC